MTSLQTDLGRLFVFHCHGDMAIRVLASPGISAFVIGGIFGRAAVRVHAMEFGNFDVSSTNADTRCSNVSRIGSWLRHSLCTADFPVFDSEASPTPKTNEDWPHRSVKQQHRQEERDPKAG